MLIFFLSSFFNHETKDSLFSLVGKKKKKKTVYVDLSFLIKMYPTNYIVHM